MGIIVIDGNIGSGKSTCISNIKEYKTINENLELFKPWLNLYYTNMEKYALGFQMEVLLSHMKVKELVNNNDTILVERSPLSCIEVFGKYLVNNNILSLDEQNLCKKYNISYGWTPNKIIYIKTDPKICYNRIIKRSRKSEETITLDYLEKIGRIYDELYLNHNSKFQVFIINGNNDKSTVIKDIIKIIKRQ